jgi:hypothetical protein
MAVALSLTDLPVELWSHGLDGLLQRRKLGTAERALAAQEMTL